MLLGIDHLVIAVTDPDAAAREFETRLGLVAGGGGRHEALGTFNRLIWLGDTYLELLGVADPALAAGSWNGPSALDALSRGGGLSTWVVATDDIEADVERLRANGSDLGLPLPGERRLPDGTAVRWTLAKPPRLGPDLPPFLIEHDPTAAEWTEADRRERANGPARLTILELGVESVDRVGRSYLRTLGLRMRPSLSGGGARDADIGRQIVRLRPRRGPATPATTVHLAVRGAGPGQVDALGCRWRIGPSTGD